MYTRIPIIALAVCLTVASSAYALRLKGNSRYTDKKVGKVENTVSDLESRIDNLETSVENDSEEQDKRIAQLEKKVDDLSKELTALDKWAHEKWDKGVEELEKANEKAENASKEAKKGVRTSSYSLGLLLPVAAIILIILGFAFWPRKTVSPSSSADSSDRPKCPRCGWEHDPKDTVCKNPNCKTQF